MTFHWKFCRLFAGAMLLLAGAGCSGINSRHSVSPASFFLPGLLKADPAPLPELQPAGGDPRSTPARPATPQAEAAAQVALAR